MIDGVRPSHARQLGVVPVARARGGGAARPPARRVPAHRGPRERAGASRCRPADAGRYQGERHFVRPDGTIVTTLVEVSAIHGDDGMTYHFCQVQDVTGWKRSEEALGHHARRDPLTGLANREMLSARLDLVIARNRHDEGLSAVLAIDLDRFKVVNDGLGHAAGDRLLIEVARRLIAGSGSLGPRRPDRRRRVRRALRPDRGRKRGRRRCRACRRGCSTSPLLPTGSRCTSPSPVASPSSTVR